MKQIWTSLKGQKNLWLFLIIIFLFGASVGIYFAFQSSSGFSNLLNNYATTFTEQRTYFAVTHFVILAVLLISSFLLIGVPLSIAYLFYEGISFGFCLSLFSILFSFKGFLFIFLFLLLTKIPFYLIYNFFLSKLISIGKSVLTWVLAKNNKKDQLVSLAISCLILISILFVYDLFLDFLGMKAIYSLEFLLH